MADQRWSDIYVVFTKILCGRNFCVWYGTELKFTEQLQMASLSLYSQFSIWNQSDVKSQSYWTSFTIKENKGS